MSINEIANQLENKIKEAVKPYEGMPISLSGGIDSSLLAAFIKPKFAITAYIKGEDERFNELKYAQIVVKHLGIEHIVLEIDESTFDEDMKVAVKAIGRPIPHFNIFPLFQLYRKLHEMGVKEIVLGDGADETMCGYARDLIVAYLYSVYNFEAFKNYKPLIDKILPDITEIIQRITANNKVGAMLGAMPRVLKDVEPSRAMSAVDVQLMRKDMDDMANGIAKHFGITNHRPYQDNKELDEFMYNLPEEAKIYNVEYGKYALRLVAEKYLPKEIAWRKVKIGGIVYPVNTKMGWLDKGEFNKEKYIDYQKEILKNENLWKVEKNQS